MNVREYALDTLEQIVCRHGYANLLLRQNEAGLSEQDMTDAKDICTQNELVLDTSNVTYTLTESTEKGKIINVSPDVGTEVDKGTSLTITVSSGIGVKIRDYTGMDIFLDVYAVAKEAALFEQAVDQNVIVLKLERQSTTLGLLSRGRLTTCLVAPAGVGTMAYLVITSIVLIIFVQLVQGIGNALYKKKA